MMKESCWPEDRVIAAVEDAGAGSELATLREHAARCYRCRELLEVHEERRVLEQNARLGAGPATQSPFRAVSGEEPDQGEAPEYRMAADTGAEAPVGAEPFVVVSDDGAWEAHVLPAEGEGAVVILVSPEEAPSVSGEDLVLIVDSTPHRFDSSNSLLLNTMPSPEAVSLRLEPR